MSRKQYPDDELIDFAERAIEYEVRMLVHDAASLHELRPDGYLGGGMPDHKWDAVLEAWLVHLRLLDDFLEKGQSHHGAAIARDWHDLWRSDGFLDEDVRDAVNDQLMHLSWRRLRWTEDTRPPWEHRFVEITDACCKELIRFFGEVRPALRPVFETPRRFAQSWLDTRKPPRP